jgi:hypothetical protein
LVAPPPARSAIEPEESTRKYRSSGSRSGSKTVPPHVESSVASSRLSLTKPSSEAVSPDADDPLPVAGG